MQVFIELMIFIKLYGWKSNETKSPNCPKPFLIEPFPIFVKHYFLNVLLVKIINKKNIDNDLDYNKVMCQLFLKLCGDDVVLYFDRKVYGKKKMEFLTHKN